ncbi:MAG: hypothetical protein DMG17_12140 [Acidobacteria bacterium]|nr:MAG: hypothetical protein DMG17_12140 [Acidobacteriota bacterium]
MHRPRAGLFIGEHACIGLVLACSSANMRARPRAGLFVGKHACTGLVLACSSASTRAPSRASFQEVLAIKCAKSGFRRWLPREVRHASEIGHPSVCRIFEIHTVPTERGEIDFLTMEFLDETLAGPSSAGPIPQNEANAIAEQLCGGLAEAHCTGVGDLKSNNVIDAATRRNYRSCTGTGYRPALD